MMPDRTIGQNPHGTTCPEELLETAQRLYGAGCTGQAAFICRKLLCDHPHSTGALHLLGILEQQAGNSTEAKRLFEELVRIEPENSSAWSNYGVVCLSLDDREKALVCFENAVRISPDNADAWNNLGAVLEKLDARRAEDYFRKALELNPDFVDAYNNLALVCKKQQRYNDAISCYRNSLSVNPDQPAILGRLAELLEHASDVEGTRAAYSRSLLLFSDDALRIKMQTVLPVILPSAGAIDAIRDDLWNNLLELDRKQLFINNPGDTTRTLFYLAYHGRNDRIFHERMGRIYRSSAPSLTWQSPHAGGNKTSDDRIRVGFISRFFYNHTIAKLNIGYVEKLDRRRFHVTVLVIPSGITDAMLKRFETAADGFVMLTGDLAAMREQVAAQRLDILMYTDIGMEPCSYLLAFARLAPVQCVTWGHPATSGIDTIDYFISHSDCETEEGRSSYSEQLFCLSPEAAVTCYARPMLESSGRSPESFGIEPGVNVYYCPQTPFKMHPDFDAMLHGILELDPHGLIVLLRGVMPQTEELLLRRFRKTIPSCRERMRFIDPLPFRDYIAMMERADVILDTPHFSGGNSSVEGFAVGAPIVTLPSQFLKGRLTYAWYRRIGIEDCIAKDAGEYVAIAARLGTDRNLREALRKRIREASDGLFDDLRAVRELEAFFERVTRT